LKISKILARPVNVDFIFIAEKNIFCCPQYVFDMLLQQTSNFYHNSKQFCCIFTLENATCSFPVKW